MEIPMSVFRTMEMTLAATVKDYVEPYLREPCVGALYLACACGCLLGSGQPKAPRDGVASAPPRDGMASAPPRDGMASAPPQDGMSSASTASHVVMYVVVSFTVAYTVPAPAPGSVPIELATTAILLALVTPMCSACGEGGHVAESIASSSRYIFAATVSRMMLRLRDPTTALLVAAATALLDYQSRRYNDPVFHEVLVLACLTVFKTVLVGSIPACLLIPTYVLIMSFTRPLAAPPGAGPDRCTSSWGIKPADVRACMNTVAEFVLYQAAQGGAQVAQAAVGGAVGGMLACTLAILAPAPGIRAMCQVAATTLITGLVTRTMRQSAPTDPVLCLLTGVLALHLAISLGSRASLACQPDLPGLRLARWTSR